MNDLCRSDGNVITHMGFDKWGLDEAYTTQQILKHESKDELVFFSRPEKRRIDRVAWSYDINVLRNMDYYIDCHSVRPYELYKEQVDRIVQELV